ncbi:hypothetical protein EN943_07435 [Mesorhizobium sp. M7A.F.Ca.US.006.01.1.1]|uniref:hypothetical protein n=1 Tax=Mesorhizobium sp. M7A.F.Ca.US.006.01.1.1 TaxID=2496707 RepID=UPI000FCC6031|nr:hypothetical protein [Mesorhizobium sp. M7A.F.Ca.US.006.01.1.1]RUZ79398.1 hypothetical protein EN943_07435 [Mesorhizobium sp. M7A.F.Ca.US.006.01.1.1]
MGKFAYVGGQYLLAARIAGLEQQIRAVDDVDLAFDFFGCNEANWSTAVLDFFKRSSFPR